MLICRTNFLFFKERSVLFDPCDIRSTLVGIWYVVKCNGMKFVAFLLVYLGPRRWYFVKCLGFSCMTP